MDTSDQNLEKMAALGRVTRSLIHDFNNSLASIMGHADFLIADLPHDSEQHLFASNIKKAALQLQDTLHQIKSFAASEAANGKPSQNSEKSIPIHHPHKPRSILLVDDRTMVLNTIATMLNRKHHKVESASDGFTALDMIRENPKKYDLLITDYTMPDLNGRDLISEIRQDFKSIPIIIMSGDTQSLDALRENRALNNIYVLPKPIVEKELDDLIAFTQQSRK